MYHAGDITKAQYATAMATPGERGVHPSVGCAERMPGGRVQYRWICDYTVNDVDNLTALGSTKAAREANWAIGGYDIYTTFNTSHAGCRHEHPVVAGPGGLKAGSISVGH